MNRDWSRCVRAVGPWVYVRPEKAAADLREATSLQVQSKGLFYPSGTYAQRRSPNRGVIISVGRGFWDEELEAWDNLGLRPGMVVWYKGYQEQLNRPHPEVNDFSFLHMRDLHGYDPSVLAPTENRLTWPDEV